jgi:hypothetical protein
MIPFLLCLGFMAGILGAAVMTVYIVECYAQVGAAMFVPISWLIVLYFFWILHPIVSVAPPDQHKAIPLNRRQKRSILKVAKMEYKKVTRNKSLSTANSHFHCSYPFKLRSKGRYLQRDEAPGYAGPRRRLATAVAPPKQQQPKKSNPLQQRPHLGGETVATTIPFDLESFGKSVRDCNLIKTDEV